MAALPLPWSTTRGDRPKPRTALNALRAGDTLVIHRPDRVARSMKELFVFLEDELHARDITALEDQRSEKSR
ncbi:recombinase family protein [Micromonospora sp. DT4]|uniref:recombinase family protein n=1 Tax=Micromonospora sp. DT4 TaxID=3393438 RepID=UPI003CF94897